MFRSRLCLCAAIMTLLFISGQVSAQSDATSAASSAGSSSGSTAAPQAAAPSAHASSVPAWTRIHRVDDFVTAGDIASGIVLADRDTPIVVFSHGRHAAAGVSCEQCHHTGVKGWEAPACATCHKGADAISVMHSACITCHQRSETAPVGCNDCHTARQASFAGIYRFELYDVVRGPLFIAAWIIFAVGFAWRIVTFTRLTRATLTRAGAPRPTMPARQVPRAADAAPGGVFARARRWVRGTVFGTHPVLGVVSLVFHVALFLLPLLLPAHNIMFFRTFRVSLPTLPEPFMDKVTLALLAIGAFFLLRRIFFPRVRALTTVRDYLILLLVAAPFVTAYMAYHQWMDFRTVLVTHMIIGEIVIAAIPFTKLGHMPFLIFARFFVSGEYAWRPGTRRW
jgi:nitrate reductase gamma subunit